MASQYTPYQHQYQGNPVNYQTIYVPVAVQPVRSRSYNDLNLASGAPYPIRGPAYSSNFQSPPPFRPPSPVGLSNSVSSSNLSPSDCVRNHAEHPGAPTPGAPILPRYRGKHIRAMSTGSIPSPKPETQSALPANGSLSTNHINNYQNYQGPPALTVNHQGHLHKQRRQRNSLSSSTVSIDTDSTRTQTSTSSAGSVYSKSSVDEDPNKQKRSIKLVDQSVGSLDSRDNITPKASQQFANGSTSTSSSQTQSTENTDRNKSASSQSQIVANSKHLLLPSDVRRRSYQSYEPENNSPRNFTRSPRPTSMRPSGVTNPSSRQFQPQHRKNLSEPNIARQKPSQGSNSGPKFDSRSLSSMSSQPKSSEPKGKSFGEKIRSIFRSKSKSDDDSQSITSNRSSSMSIRSMNSLKSFSSRFSRKSRGETKIPSSPSLLSMQTLPNEPIAPQKLRQREQHIDGDKVDTSSNQNSEADYADSSCDNSIAPLRPPSPALRSTISVGNDRALSPISVDQQNLPQEPPSDNGHLAAVNLSAGDIFPGELKPENVETIVSSVQRTGSFKRQPSTSKRTKEEIVPDAQEVEMEEPQHNSQNLISAMKQGRSRRKRSGATNADQRRVQFANQILVYKTYSAQGYDRVPDYMTCDQLSEPGVAQKLREELNHWKALMPIHPSSVENTQFFHT